MLARLGILWYGASVFDHFYLFLFCMVLHYHSNYFDFVKLMLKVGSSWQSSQQWLPVVPNECTRHQCIVGVLL